MILAHVLPKVDPEPVRRATGRAGEPGQEATAAINACYGVCGFLLVLGGRKIALVDAVLAIAVEEDPSHLLHHSALVGPSRRCFLLAPQVAVGLTDLSLKVASEEEATRGIHQVKVEEGRYWGRLNETHSIQEQRDPRLGLFPCVVSACVEVPLAPIAQKRVQVVGDVDERCISCRARGFRRLRNRRQNGFWCSQSHVFACI